MTLVWILVGAFIGWNLPQPMYAIMLQDYIKAKYAEFKKK